MQKKMTREEIKRLARVRSKSTRLTISKIKNSSKSSKKPKDS